MAKILIFLLLVFVLLYQMMTRGAFWLQFKWIYIASVEGNSGKALFDSFFRQWNWMSIST